MEGDGAIRATGRDAGAVVGAVAGIAAAGATFFGGGAPTDGSTFASTTDVGAGAGAGVAAGRVGFGARLISAFGLSAMMAFRSSDSAVAVKALG